MTTLNYKNNNYVVTEVQKGIYFTIDAKDISNGRITKSYNGITGCMGKTPEEAIENRKQRIDFTEMYEAGCSLEEIAKAVFDKQ